MTLRRLVIIAIAIVGSCAAGAACGTFQNDLKDSDDGGHTGDGTGGDGTGSGGDAPADQGGMVGVDGAADGGGDGGDGSDDAGQDALPGTARVSCGSTVCDTAGKACCTTGGPDGRCALTCSADEGRLACDGPTDCPATQVCCASRSNTVLADGGIPPYSSACAATCVGTLQVSRRILCDTTQSVNGCPGGSTCDPAPTGFPTGYESCQP